MTGLLGSYRNKSVISEKADMTSLTALLVRGNSMLVFSFVH